jgi:hypothetical protein
MWPMDRIATFHVVRERRGRQLVVMTRMLTDRWRLRRVDGLVFAKVLGTGRGDDTGPSADLLRQAYLLVWRDAEAARDFLTGHPISRRWVSLDVQRELALGLGSGHGTWSGRAMLDGLQRVAAEGEVVVLTRARIRLRWWWAFRTASRHTARADVPGRCWAIGVGELPVGLLGTVSCWRSAADLDAWLAADTTHAEAAAHGGDWFAESLFARLVPVELPVRRGSPAR